DELDGDQLEGRFRPDADRRRLRHLLDLSLAGRVMAGVELCPERRGVGSREEQGQASVVAVRDRLFARLGDPAEGELRGLPIARPAVSESPLLRPGGLDNQIEALAVRYLPPLQRIGLRP